MRLIDADELLNEFDRLDLDYGATGGVAECIAITEQAPTIEPNKLDLDIDYSIEYDKRPDGISNAKVTITRIKPRGIIACEKVDELDMLERMNAEPSGDLISREEAIEVVGDWMQKEYGYLDLNRAERLIDALSSRPSAEYSKPLQTTLNSDLVSRADAIEVGNKIVEELSLSSIDWDDLKHWAKELFDALPSADRPQGKDWERYSEKLWHLAYERGKNGRPRGEWIIRDDMPKLDNTYSIECSECGQLMFGHYNADNPNFCPHCGADMRGEEHE